MNVLLFGATGMVGEGVLRECLRDPGVRLVQTVGRTATGVHDPKTREIVREDLWHYDALADRLAGFDACFFCLGVSVAGMSEEAYTHITYGITLAAAQILARLNPGMTFIYVSGSGTDSSERGRVMWARVKGKTENALQRLPFRAVYLFRPGIIQPLHGARSSTPAYRIAYTLLAPVLPLLRRLFPRRVTTTEALARAMLVAARQGAPRPVVEARDIEALARTWRP